jgi:hypothetical protein
MSLRAIAWQSHTMQIGSVKQAIALCLAMTNNITIRNEGLYQS